MHHYCSKRKLELRQYRQAGVCCAQKEKGSEKAAGFARAESIGAFRPFVNYDIIPCKA